MKYIGIVQSSDFSNREQYIILNPSNPKHSRKMPSGGEYPKFITGFIKNRSFSYAMKVIFMTARREAQTLMVNPLTEIELKHQPCDEIIVSGLSGAPPYAYFDYSFRCIQTESEIESKELLLQSKLSRRDIDLEEHIQTNIVTEQVVNDLNIATFEIHIPFTAYQEIAIKEVVLSPAHASPPYVVNQQFNLVAFNWHVGAGIQPVARNDELFNLNIRSSFLQPASFATKKPYTFRRDISFPGYFSIRVENDGGGGGDVLYTHISYATSAID